MSLLLHASACFAAQFALASRNSYRLLRMLTLASVLLDLCVN
jgi:hypothetical protein